MDRLPKKMIMKILYAGTVYKSKFSRNGLSDNDRRWVNVVAVTGITELTEAVAMHQPDLILVDYEGPLCWRSAMSLLRRKSITVPFIILGTQISEDAATEAFRLGALDYITVGEMSRSAEQITDQILRYKAEQEIPGASYKLNVLKKERATERRKAENLTRFKAHLLNNIGQAVVATDNKGIITYWNSAAEELFGHKTTDVSGTMFTDLVAPVHTVQAAEMWQTINSGNVWSGEVSEQDQTGQHHTYQITARPIYDDRRQFEGMITITTNITEQRRLEKLVRSSARLAKLGHFEIDISNNTLYRSDYTKEIHGTPYAEVDVHTALRAYREGASREIAEKAYNDAVDYGKGYDIEVELIADDATDRCVRIIGEVEKRNGKAVRIFGSIQDITQYKNAEKAALDAFRERDVILESIGDAFFAVDRNWRVNYWNSNAEQVLSTNRDDVLGKVVWDVFPEYIGTEAYEQYHRAMQTQAKTEFDEFFFSFQKWLQVSVFPSPLGLSIYFKDITDRKLSELKMLELNENLQEYANDLVAVNLELKQFSYIVSHNLRAPVTNIMGLVEELSDGGYDRETQQMIIDLLKSSAGRLNSVITDLNDVLQLKADGNKRKEKLTLTTVTGEVLATISTQIAAENGTVLTDFDSIDEIFTVRSYLHSIIYNLVSNALKYRRPDVPPVVRIKSQPTSDGIALTFTDNGSGIDLQSTKDDLFGMYKRFHLNVEGKGIGLFMVKTQLEILGGSISVESRVGEGTTFTLFFPE